MNLLAKIISVLFHPLIMPSYLCGLLMFILPSGLEPLKQEVYPTFLVFIFLVTFLFPAVFIFVFKLFGTIPSFIMEERKDRILPFSFITFLYAAVTILFYFRFRVDLTDNIMKFMLIIDFLVSGALIATFFYKISIHSLGICGIVGVLLPLNTVANNSLILYATTVSIVLAGLVMTSRLHLNAHSPREIMVGSVVGFMISFMSVLNMF